MNKTLTSLLAVVSVGALVAAGAWYQASSALHDSRPRVVASELQPIATLLNENQALIKELQAAGSGGSCARNRRFDLGFDLIEGQHGQFVFCWRGTGHDEHILLDRRDPGVRNPLGGFLAGSGGDVGRTGEPTGEKCRIAFEWLGHGPPISSKTALSKALGRQLVNVRGP